VDVTGLSPEAVRVVEKFVASLREQQGRQDVPGDPWAAAVEAAKGLVGYDFRAWEEQRAFDGRHGQDHLK
jgi:hypothetical protein